MDRQREIAMGKILLVGGAGYVGSVLTEELLERGYAVNILDRLYYGEFGLNDVRNRIKLIVEDMRNIKPENLEGTDTVINLGGLSNDPTAEYNPKANYEMNTIAAQRLAELCKEKGVRRYILASSCSIYDRGVGNDQVDILQTEESTVNPRAAYSRSKYDAENYILAMADKDFCPVILRKGTIFGFSPRMRFDLVVNTFVKDAFLQGKLTLNYGGEMWRPLVDVRDVARAYIACIEASEEKVHSQIFNISFQNVRISELALRVREALRENGLEVDVRPNFTYKGVRSYRVSAEKIQRTLGIFPKVTIEESVVNMVNQVKKYDYMDFENPKYYNIRWMTLLEEAKEIIKITDSIF